MRIRRVNRYYCEFCKKAGCSGFHMKRHEDSCTLNPKRICRVCKMAQGVQQPIETLISILPTLSDDEKSAFGPLGGMASVKVNAALVRLREVCSDCPACIMAALRQSKIPVPIATDFNWTTEMKAVWDTINNLQYERISA